jgi:hypothetical protein
MLWSSEDAARYRIDDLHAQAQRDHRVRAASRSAGPRLRPGWSAPEWWRRLLGLPLTPQHRLRGRLS